MRGSPHIPSLLRALEERSLITRATDVRELSGNVDRKPERARWHCLVQQDAGPALKITIAHDLRSIAEAARAFGARFPALTPRHVFFSQVDDWQICGTEAVDGARFEELDRDGHSTARLLLAMDDLQRAFREVEEPSSDAAFAQEWSTFAASVSELACWTPAQREFMSRDVLPLLAGRLKHSGTTRRWTNGDFISTNLCLRAGNLPLIFDAEYAALSHFHAEDWVRFQRISPLCHRHPGLLRTWWPAIGDPWEVFFQLRQLRLEQLENTLRYIQTATPARLAAIRYFGASWLGDFPADWPPPASPPPHDGGEAVQLFWRDHGQPFTEAQSLRVPIHLGTRQLAAFRLPGRYPFWRMDPADAARPIVLHSLTAMWRNRVVPVPLETLQFVNARPTGPSTKFQLSPLGPDPQVHFSLPDDTSGLVVDLQCG